MITVLREAQLFSDVGRNSFLSKHAGREFVFSVLAARLNQVGLGGERRVVYSIVIDT